MNNNNYHPHGLETIMEKITVKLKPKSWPMCENVGRFNIYTAYPRRKGKGSEADKGYVWVFV